jgi:hypothetical protein
VQISKATRVEASQGQLKPWGIEPGQQPRAMPRVIGTIAGMKRLELSGALSAEALTDPERPQLARPLRWGRFFGIRTRQGGGGLLSALGRL